LFFLHVNTPNKIIASYRQNNTGAAPAVCFPLIDGKIISEILYPNFQQVRIQFTIKGFTQFKIFYHDLREFLRIFKKQFAAGF